MILTINSTAKFLQVELKDKDGHRFAVEKKRTPKTEKLVGLVVKLFQDKQIKWRQLRKIEVVNQGDSFTAVRLGVVIANALGYALDCPVVGTKGKTRKVDNLQIVIPCYHKPPNITVKR
ncbi:hypothetical protein D6821_01625 [Candidatus Parcubacteria bacterium]|nr:MAG: hypothetical protein D6821_01625 [Candidatus Parcubacteria bacterium]